MWFGVRVKLLKWNFDLGSKFIVALWQGSQFYVEFWPVNISSTHGIVTQGGVKIQQRAKNSTAQKEYHSTKNPLNNDPGPVFNGGGGEKFNLTPDIFPDPVPCVRCPEIKKKCLVLIISGQDSRIIIKLPV